MKRRERAQAQNNGPGGRRVRHQVKRRRVGGSFTYDEQGKLASVDLMKAIELSSTMAVELLATWEALGRAVAATVAKDRGRACSASFNWPLVMLKERLDRLATAEELARALSVEELVEMQKCLSAGLVRHLQAHDHGYGDALRLGRLRANARDLRRMSAGQKVLTDRHIKGEPVAPTEEVERTANGINHMIAGMRSLGNESSARLLLKRGSAKTRFYVDEIEPRASKRRRG